MAGEDGSASDGDEDGGEAAAEFGRLVDRAGAAQVLFMHAAKSIAT